MARVFCFNLLAGKETENDEGIVIFGRQEAFILKQGLEGVPVESTNQPSEPPQLQGEYAGMLTPEMKKPMEIEEENALLK